MKAAPQRALPACPGARPRLTLVTNAAEGNMVRRAGTLARHLAPSFEARVLAAPGWRSLPAGLRESDLAYVIDPGRVGFPAALAARVSGRPVVVEMGDPQSGLYRAQGRGLPSLLAGAAIDRAVAAGATGVVVRGRGLAEILPLRVPWVEIPDGVDTDLFQPVTSGGVRAELGIPPGALVAGCVGSVEWSETTRTCYGWDLVEALGLLDDLPVWALVVGDGSGAERLRRRAEKLGVAERLVMPGRVPHERVPAHLCAMDVCVSTQSNDDVGRSRTTAKLPEYLACDRFVLATAVGAAAEVLPGEMQLPYRGSRDDLHPARLARRLADLLPRTAELRRGAGTRPLALQHYSYVPLARRLTAFLREVLAR